MLAAVFTVEQLIETITVIGPPGSFISPGGPMNHYVGGLLSVVFVAGLGFALAAPDTASVVSTRDDTEQTADTDDMKDDSPEHAHEPVGD